MYSWPISSYRTINSLFPSECLADRNVTQVGLLSAVKLTFFFSDILGYCLLFLCPGSDISRFSVSKEFPLGEAGGDTVEQGTLAPLAHLVYFTQ